jgi:HPt (histidine-containing phosphotransfer) domain-containing protein
MSDLNNDFNSSKNKIKAVKSFLEISSAAKQLKKSAGNSFAQSKEELNSSLESITKDQKRYTRNQPTSSDQLIDLISLVNGSGISTTKYLKRKLLDVVVKIEPEVKQIITESSIKALGCSQEQTFTGFDKLKLEIDELPKLDPSQGIYVPIKSLDLASLLKTQVDSKLGKISFEKKDPSVQSGTFKPYSGPQPFPMNKELRLRLNSTGQSFYTQYGKFYQGTSGLPLFDFMYSPTNQYNVTEDCYRVALIDKPTPNKVGDFLNDYYSTIKLIDSVDVTELLVNIVTGAISIQGNQSAGQIGENSKFQAIVNRILGLCFDGRREIDVSGVSKVAELDGVDDSFFELTEVDLRNIDVRISNIQNGVMEFEDCNNVKLPVDYQTLVDELIKFRDVLDDQTTEEQVNTISNILDTIYQNPDWNELLPTNFNLELAVNKDFLKQIPLAVASAVLSPKVLFPIFILLQVVESNAVNNYNSAVTEANPILQSGNTAAGEVNNIVNNSNDFLKVFKSFNVEVVSKIGAVFLRVLYEELKKDILNLIGSIITDVVKSQKLKKYRIILRLINILLILSQLVDDYRKCKSLINSILQLLQLIFGRPDGSIPLPLLFLTQFLPGYSPERSSINTIELLQSVGIPTGPLPDGSPNLMGLYNLMSNIGVDNEESDNGKTEGTVITPLGIYPVYSKKR